MKHLLKLTLALMLLVGIAFAQQEKAPEIRKSDIWINSAPQTLRSLKGKVVVVDFWAFDCAPCIEVMPHLLDLYDKYTPQGVVFIGVHAPRTDDEKDVAKLRSAVARMRIKFPVVADNQHKIFTDYRCDLWPTVFVIDKNGMIRFSHGGVGRYDDLEKTVQEVLGKD